MAKALLTPFNLYLYNQNMTYYTRNKFPTTFYVCNVSKQKMSLLAV